MPGGATKKPDAFYELYGFFKQATEGDNTEEQPVWAETGGLDFEGRYVHEQYERYPVCITSLDLSLCFTHWHFAENQPTADI